MLVPPVPACRQRPGTRSAELVDGDEVVLGDGHRRASGAASTQTARGPARGVGPRRCAATPVLRAFSSDGLTPWASVTAAPPSTQRADGGDGSDRRVRAPAGGAGAPDDRDARPAASGRAAEWLEQGRMPSSVRRGSSRTARSPSAAAARPRAAAGPPRGPCRPSTRRSGWSAAAPCAGRAAAWRARRGWRGLGSSLRSRWKMRAEWRRWA